MRNHHKRRPSEETLVDKPLKLLIERTHTELLQLPVIWPLESGKSPNHPVLVDVSKEAELVGFGLTFQNNDLPKVERRKCIMKHLNRGSIPRKRPLSMIWCKSLR